MTEWPNIDTIRKAAERIAPYAVRTPVMTSSSVDAMAGAKLFFKCENFQKVGAFKFRGACNAVFSLEEEVAAKGVVTHSSGNHAQALALAAKLRGIRAQIVMPNNAPQVKQDAVAGYGGEIVYCEPTLQSRETTAAGIIEKTGAVLIHSYNDPRIVAGQGTAALELFEEVPDLDVVMTPVGGGGLLSGTSLTTHAVSPKTKVIAAEPEGADDAYRSFHEGKYYPSVNPNTIAEGLLTSLGEDLTFPIIQKHVSDIVLVSDDEIIEAMRRIWERMKLVIETSSAVPVAAVLKGKVDVAGKRVGIILSGGNVDLAHLPWIQH